MAQKKIAVVLFESGGQDSDQVETLREIGIEHCEPARTLRTGLNDSQAFIPALVDVVQQESSKETSIGA